MTAFPHEDPDLLLTPLKLQVKALCSEIWGHRGEKTKLWAAAFLPKS